MARLAQRAENGWVGVNCGIMDQLISAAGTAGHALLIDCRSLESDPVRMPASVGVVVLDTSTKRGLVDSAYNERRAQCEAVARFFGVRALRDVSATDFAARSGELEEMPRRRARHVLSENARTLAAARALNTGDVVEVGRLMNASHASLRDDFEVSRRELDEMVSIATAHPGCHGARMTGAGFGGCAVALVASERLDDFVQHVGPAYHRAVGLTPSVYVCRASAGASVERTLS
jgi:galactokinase